MSKLRVDPTFGISSVDVLILTERHPACRRREGGGPSTMNRANWQREEPEVQRKAAAFNRWHEPDDARVSSPDLCEARGEIPRAYSAIASIPHCNRGVRSSPDNGHSLPTFDTHWAGFDGEAL